MDITPTLMKGDCLERMKEIETGSIDLILTDPPYGISKKNNLKTMGRAGIDFGAWDHNIDYLSWIELAKQKLSKVGSLFIFNDWKKLGDISAFSEEVGLVTKDMFRWVKSNPMPRNRDRRYITDFETAIWLTQKDKKWRFNRGNVGYERPEFNCPVVNSSIRIHPNQKPVSLLTYIIERHTDPGDTIFDPFMGSFSTAIAAINTGRRFIGIEMETDYFDVGFKRVQDHIDNLGLDVHA